MTENMKNKDVTSLVSVVVPIYNVESYLKECVDSILFQTYKNMVHVQELPQRNMNLPESILIKRWGMLALLAVLIRILVANDG